MTDILSDEDLIKALEARGMYKVNKLPASASKGTGTTDPTKSPPGTPTSDPARSLFTPGRGRAARRKGEGATPALDAGGRGHGVPSKDIGTSTPRVGDLASHDDTVSVGRTYVPVPQAPRLSFFSGEDQKGDASSYYEWHFEVKCLLSDEDLTPSTVAQAIRKSLRGPAKMILTTLGENASVDIILRKLDTLYGDVSSHGMIMQEFFNSTQRPGESVTSFGCRLEYLLQIAVEHGKMTTDGKNDALKHKFWTGLSSEHLRSQTRHKYDSLSDYDSLLREIRIVEKEMENYPSSQSQPSSKKATQQPVVVDSQLAAMEKRYDQKLVDLESRFDTKLDDKFGQILQRLDCLPDNRGSQHQSNGNSGFRGSNRGYRPGNRGKSGGGYNHRRGSRGNYANQGNHQSGQDKSLN